MLEHNGHKAQAESVRSVCDAVAESMRPYLDWLTEAEAQIASGWAVPRLRRLHPTWESIGMAKTEGEGRKTRRFYRRCIVPKRANAYAAYQEGLKAS